MEYKSSLRNKQTRCSLFYKLICKLIQWRNWVKTWAGALSRFLGIHIGENWEEISKAAISHFLQLILILVWNAWNETYVFIMKFTVPWSLLPETVVQFLTRQLYLIKKSLMTWRKTRKRTQPTQTTFTLPLNDR